jgi:hypothetical protein
MHGSTAGHSNVTEGFCSGLLLCRVVLAGRLDFTRADYRCSRCSTVQSQRWREMLQLGYFPRSLHDACETFVELQELARLRQAMRHQSPTGWKSRAATLNATGARLYNQVRAPTGSAVF